MDWISRVHLAFPEESRPDPDVIEELAQHARATYDAARADGLPEAAAHERVDDLFRRWRSDSRALERPVHRRAALELSTPKRAWPRLLTGLLPDCRYTVRGLARTPAFTALAMLVLALGIGFNTAVFSVINAALFSFPGVPASGELRFIYTSNWRLFGIRRADLDYVREHQDVFESLASEARDEAKLGSGASAHMIRGEQVSANYFDVLRVSPGFGRALAASDIAPDAPLTVVISDDLWTAEFHRDPNVLGRTLRLGYRYYENIPDQWPDYTVVGVMPPGFRGIGSPFEPTEYWVLNAQRVRDHAVRMRDGSTRVLSGENVWEALPFGRLRPGITDARARLVVRTLGAQTPSAAAHVVARLTPESEPVTFGLEVDSRRVFLPFDSLREIPTRTLAGVFIIVSMLVLVVATANLAGMLLARGASRRREIATRLMLGADCVRLVRQLVVEGLLLASAAGVAGVGLAKLLVVGLLDQTPAQFGWVKVPIVFDVQVDSNVLLFTVGACVLAAVLTSLAPARQAWRTNLVAAASGGAFTTRRQGRIRHWVLVPQVAASAGLLIIAGSVAPPLIESLIVNPGYAADRTSYVEFLVPYPSPRPTGAAWTAALEQHDARNHQILEDVERTPGITSAALTEMMPLSPWSTWIVGRDGFPSGRHWYVSALGVTPDYFTTMGIRLRQGRSFDIGDVRASAPVAIVCDRLAAWLWPGQNPIGQHLARHQPNASDPPQWTEVVGVVSEVKSPLSARPNPTVYWPAWQSWHRDLRTVVARGTLSPADVTHTLERATVGSDSTIEIMASGTIAQAIAARTYPRRMATAILSVAGLLALALAAIGIYGVVSYSVAQRTREIGIRATLGASRGRLMGLVFRDGTIVTVIGLALGFGLAAVGIQLALRALPDISHLDSRAAVVVPAVVVAVVALACLVPARRASRVDPVTVLRD